MSYCHKCGRELDDAVDCCPGCLSGTRPVFSHCNVCGRGLVRADELAVGMCAICANEEITQEDWERNPPPMPPHMEP